MPKFSLWSRIVISFVKRMNCISRVFKKQTKEDAYWQAVALFIFLILLPTFLSENKHELGII